MEKENTVVRYMSVDITKVIPGTRPLTPSEFEKCKTSMANFLKKQLDADDVIITSCQDFETKGRKNRKKKESR